MSMMFEKYRKDFMMADISSKQPLHISVEGNITWDLVEKLETTSSALMGKTDYSGTIIGIKSRGFDVGAAVKIGQVI